LSVSLQRSDPDDAGHDVQVVFRDDDGDVVFWFDDEAAIRQVAEIAGFGLALLVDATVLGFDGAVDTYHLTLEDCDDE
jgi:hypothetical protein